MINKHDGVDTLTLLNGDLQILVGRASEKGKVTGCTLVIYDNEGRYYRCRFEDSSKEEICQMIDVLQDVRDNWAIDELPF